MSTRREFITGLGAMAAPCILGPVPALGGGSEGDALDLVQTAIPADQFVESIGICGHLTWRQTVWGTGDWQPLLLELGIRSIRTAAGSGGVGRAAVADLNGLLANGLRANIRVGPIEAGEYDLRKAEAMLDLIATDVDPTKILGIEGPNEPNNPPVAEDWAEKLRTYQRWLYETVNGDPALADIPVVGPSIWGRLESDYERLGALGDAIDIANLHYYTGGRRPSVAGRPSAIDEGGGDLEYLLSDAIAHAQAIAPEKPLWVTEFGYGMSGERLAPARGFVTPESAAKYILRGLAEMFVNGVGRTFIYSLIDDDHRDPPRYHGLLTADLQKRPAFDALARLIALLGDPGHDFYPSDLAWRQVGNSSIRQLPLMQKRDGIYYLVLWQDVDSYNRDLRRDEEFPPAQITLEFANPLSSLRVYAPTLSAQPVAEHSFVRAVPVDVFDHLTVLELAV